MAPANHPLHPRVADPHHQNESAVVTDLTNDTTVAYPITPKAAEGTPQSLACCPWIAKTCNALVHMIQDTLGHLPIQLAKLTRGRLRVLNRPSQEIALTSSALYTFS